MGGVMENFSDIRQSAHEDRKAARQKVIDRVALEQQRKGGDDRRDSVRHTSVRADSSSPDYTGVAMLACAALLSVL